MLYYDALPQGACLQVGNHLGSLHLQTHVFGLQHNSLKAHSVKLLQGKILFYYFSWGAQDKPGGVGGKNDSSGRALKPGFSL